MKYHALIGNLRKHVSSSVLLVLATVLALLVANSPLREQYKELWLLPVSLRIGEFDLFAHGTHSLGFGEFINDFLMAIFFLSVGLEIKREVLCGELSSPRKALAPFIGACGGMIVPVLVFLLVCPPDASMRQGMAVPMATDIAFSLGCLSVFSRRCPVSLKIFLAALAVADDLGGIFVIAIRYTQEIHFRYVGLALACVAGMMLGNWRNVRLKSFYATFGIMLWYCMLNSGIHSTIAGVVTAFCIPANLPNGTKYYINVIRRSLSHFPITEVTHEDRNKPTLLTDEEILLLKRVERSSDRLISPLQDMEDILKIPINFYVIPLFAFANAGVDFTGMSPQNLFGGVGLAVFLGLWMGKFVGVFSFSWIFIRLGVIRLPHHATWASFAGISMLCGIGFTVSMFMASLSYPAREAVFLNDAKLGILCGTILSALTGLLILHFTLPSPKRMELLQAEEG